MKNRAEIAATEVPRVDPARILVAIPALNEEKHIEACLQSLIGKQPGMRAVAIAVADGGSTDATRTIVGGLQKRFPNIILIDNPDRLQSAAVNRIVRECAAPAHEILVRCDAHAVYPPNYVMNVAASLLARDAASLATPLDAVAGGTCFQKAAAWTVDTPVGSGGSPHRGGRRSGYVAHGHHAGFRLDMFRRLGGYDESFSHNEDAEFDHRLKLAGGRVWLDAEIRIGYQMRDSLRLLAKQYWRYGRGRAKTMMKHKMAPQLRQAAPVANVVGLTLSLLLALIHPVFLIWPAAYGLLLAGMSIWVALRRGSVCGLFAGPALAAMHLAWGAGFIWQTVAGSDEK